MDIAASDQWSTGCESGWTVYLDESYIPRSDTNVIHPQSYRIKSNRNDDDEEEDEDLSMVSDASSGPPHFYVQGDDARSYSQNNNNCYYSTTSEKSSKKSDKRSSKKKTSNKEHKKVMSANKQQQQQQYHHLDDTASSPATTSTYSKMYDNYPSNMGYSQNYSATHFEGNSSYSNYTFWQSSHVKDTDYTNEPGELSGRGWQ